MRNTHAFYPISLLFALFFLPQTIFSQEQLGMRLERYAGIYSAGINPANTAFTPHNWEVSLFNADLFVENSYAFLRNTSLQNALRNTDKIVSLADTSAENPPARDAILQDFTDGSRKMHFVTQVRIAGPAFSFRIGENNVVGLTTAFRTNVSAYRIPEILAYRTISDLPRNQAINIPPAGIAGMAWGEIGLHYSRLEEMGDLQMAWGVSPKLLLGYEGFFTRAQSRFDYTQRNGDTTAFGSAKWDYALTTANLTDNADEVALKKQGSGFGLDLGVSWAMPAGDEEDGYAWRVGVSLVDLGFMRFKNTAERHHIEFDTMLTVSGGQFPHRANADEVLRDVSRAFLGDSAASLQKRAFGMGLPTALSAQFDARVAPLIYVSGLLVQRMPLSKYSVKRPSTLAVVPRFEHRWFSASLPLVVDDWRTFRVGAAIRLAWLYLGTDNLGSFTSKDKLSGADVYIGLKINAFSLNFKKREKGYKLHREGGGHSRGPNRKKIKCYNF
ncbi:MAG: hypothetical protein H7246_13715 [Phycisphaerae bacterium]|nr:hypothetical protein [Saprospiraceae bacterium]